MITGGAGFIGSHLCDEFVAQNDEVIVLTRTSSSTDRISHLLDKITIERADVTNYDEVGKIIEKHRPEAIIHLAGETSHSKSFENPMYDLDVNTKSTLFILEKIKQLGLKCRFVLGSTFIVVGKPQVLPVNEESICNPTTIYGANRLASEVYCKIYHNVFGLDTVSFRITNSFGPREQYVPNKNAINFLIYKAFKGEEITIFDKGNFFRDLVYVSDVVSAIEISKKTVSKIKQNLAYAFVYNVILIPVAAFGFLHPALSGIAMAASSVSVTLSSLSLKHWKPSI